MRQRAEQRLGGYRGACQVAGGGAEGARDAGQITKLLSDARLNSLAPAPSGVLVQSLVDIVLDKVRIRLHDEIQTLPQLGSSPRLVSDDRR